MLFLKNKKYLTTIRRFFLFLKPIPILKEIGKKQTAELIRAHDGKCIIYISLH